MKITKVKPVISEGGIVSKSSFIVRGMVKTKPFVVTFENYYDGWGIKKIQVSSLRDLNALRPFLKGKSQIDRIVRGLKANQISKFYTIDPSFEHAYITMVNDKGELRYYD